MNRVIKFRAWNKNRMIPWEEFQYSDKYKLSILNGIEGVDIKIMQFTGLTDKNGTEIYEGDICSSFSIRGYIFYCEAHACFTLGINMSGDPQNGGNITMDTHLSNMDMTEIRVIGNSYENPELLGEKQ